MKALIIHSNWLDMILSGEKIWELRSRITNIRGEVALIRKGSGCVCATANIVGVKGPLSEEQMAANLSSHRVPRSYWEPFESFSWKFAWILESVDVLDNPIPYQHRPGAVIWVELDDRCIKELGRARSGARWQTEAVPSPRTISPSVGGVSPPAESAKSSIQVFPGPDQRRPESDLPKPKAQSGLGYTESTKLGLIRLTQGNINNNHFYLRGIKELLPEDAIGGSNSATKAKKSLTIHWGGPSPAISDVAGDKMIFRSRGWIGDLFSVYSLRAGDELTIEKVGEYELNIQPRRAEKTLIPGNSNEN